MRLDRIVINVNFIEDLNDKLIRNFYVHLKSKKFVDVIETYLCLNMKKRENSSRTIFFSAHVGFSRV